MKHDLLSKQSVDALRILTGRTVHTIWTPSLDAAGTHLAAWKLAMILGQHHYVNFSCDWNESRRFLNDSWLIHITESSEPIGIKQDASGAWIEPCSISMSNARPVRRIVVYEYRDESDGIEDESVHYDRAILFQTEGDREFCISCMLNGPGIATYLHFSEDASVIQEMVADSTVRLTLE